MAAASISERADFTFEAGDYDIEVLRVLRFHGVEAISQLPWFEIQLSSTDSAVELDALVGEKACLAWKGQEENRWVHGIVSRFEVVSHSPTLTYYSARLVPKVWTLTLRLQCRIFQNLATPDIFKQVFDEAGIASDLVKYTLKRSYKPRKYCVQYRESDFDFLSRLMEEEGIFYFFEHSEDGHVMHIADDAGAHVEIGGEPTAPYKAGGTGLIGGHQIRRFRLGRAVRIGAVTMREFDFKKPSLDMTAESKADAWKNLEKYDYPGEYPDNSLGKELVKIRLEEEQVPREKGEGDGDVRNFIPGYQFTLEDYPRDALNQKYLITSVQHWGSQPQAGVEDAMTGFESEVETYRNTFECIPAPVPFRAPRLTPRPRVDGPQTAIVTGPAGEEIHCDEFGRVKVKFHWDRLGPDDDKSSCWVRVAQAQSSGSMLLPRVGWEVIVEFLEGDPDRPIITGRLHNGEDPGPYELPGSKTMTSIKSLSSPGGGGTNEIRFEDASGGEEVFIHAQKDKNVVIGHDHTRTVDNDETIYVKSNRTKTVDIDQSETIGANKTIEVGANHKETIRANMKLDVGADRTTTIGSSETVTIGATKSETVAAGSGETVGGAKGLSVGAAYAILVGAAMSETVGGDRTESVGGSSSEGVKGTKSIWSAGNLSISTDAAGSIQTKSTFGVSVGDKGSIDVTKDLAIAAKENTTYKAKKILIQAEDEIIIKSGDAEVTLKKNGDITIKGNKINIKGSGDVIVKGSKIAQN